MKIVLPNADIKTIDTAVQANVIYAAYGNIIKSVITDLESQNILGGDLIFYRTGASNIVLARISWDRVSIDIYPTVKPIEVLLRKTNPNWFRQRIYQTPSELLTLDAFIKRALAHLTLTRTVSYDIPVNPATP